MVEDWYCPLVEGEDGSDHTFLHHPDFPDHLAKLSVGFLEITFPIQDQ